MDVVIVAQYMRDVENLAQGNSRFWYLAQMLKTSGHQVEIISSDYHHERKKHFGSFFGQDDINVTLCHEDGYPKNVCLKRFVSHRELSRDIKKYLQMRKLPDLVYAAIPSLDVAYGAAAYCKKMKIPFILDIQDLWPEAFKMIVNIPVISDIGFWPMERKANKIYEAADGIIAASQTYLDRAMRVNQKANGEVVYIGTDKQAFDRCTLLSEKKNDEKIRLVYVGTLGSSYDLSTVFKAIRRLDSKYKSLIEMVVMGDGPRRGAFENEAEGLPVLFLGALPYAEMVSRLAYCDIAINPIVHGSAGSIINKHMDYAMAGLPVINTQECLEYRQLLEKWQCGINCECGNADDVANAICNLLDNPEKRTWMGKRSRRMGEVMFDRAETYKEILKMIERVCSGDSIKA